MDWDKRYITVKKLITAGELHSFQEIIDTIPKSIIARDLGMNNTRFTKLMNKVELFWLRDLYRLAEIIGVDGMIIINLVHQQYLSDKDNKKKK